MLLVRPEIVVIERDNGICQMCGLNTLWIERISNHIRDHLRDFNIPGKWQIKNSYYKDIGWASGRYTPYDIDHIIPIVKGGEHHPGNMRTLCQPCHKKETGKLAGELAEDRQREKEEASDQLSFKEIHAQGN